MFISCSIAEQNYECVYWRVPSLLTTGDELEQTLPLPPLVLMTRTQRIASEIGGHLMMHFFFLSWRHERLDNLACVRGRFQCGIR